MRKAVIFDMDGVIAHSESLWNEKEPAYLRKILSEDAASQIIGKTRGLSESLIYERATSLGYTGTRQDFYEGYNVLAQTIYPVCTITAGIDDLFGELKRKGALLGLVSSSPMDWIRMVTNRLSNESALDFVESVNSHPELRPKPAPDGYLAAMKTLGVAPAETLIIEDSQTGVNAAIASGASICCFTLHAQSMPTGVTAYAHTIENLRSACLAFIR